MKVRNVLLLVLATVLLFNCSCQKPQSGQESSSDGEVIEQPEPQRMAYHLGEAYRLGEDVYFVNSPSFTKSQIFATEYGSENFDIFIPCFDAVCNHSDRLKCCIATFYRESNSMKIAAYEYNGQTSVLLFNPIDICLSMPYSNFKINLLCEDFLENDLSTASKAYSEWLKSEARVQRSEPLIYRDYLYYVELKSGTRTQYRITLSGGEPERVFEEDNIIIRTIINDRFYGIRYDGDMGENISTRNDRDKIHYFRSDMNYENVENLPEILDFFELQCDGKLFSTKSNAILCADSEFIYVLNDMKVWKIPDSDINAEPVLISDMAEKIPEAKSVDTLQALWYNDGVLYIVSNEGLYGRSLLNASGVSASSTQWYKKSILYCFDITTGECRSLDISSENYLITEILYADGEYLYGYGRYAHHDSRGESGLTMRLTLDTQRYEVILPDRFTKYSGETASE